MYIIITLLYKVAICSNHTKNKKSIARRFSGTRDASLRDQQLKRQAFFGSFFQRLEKMNNTKQNKIQPINKNL